MHENTPALRIRDLMPKGYIRKLYELTGCKSKSSLSDTVTYEVDTSQYWPAVLRLAAETNPEGFAQWQAAQTQPVAAGA